MNPSLDRTTAAGGVNYSASQRNQSLAVPAKSANQAGQLQPIGGARPGLRVRSLAASLSALLALGCVPTASSPPSVSANQFRDLIVPAGLRLVDDAHQSYAAEAGSWRHGYFLYRGRVPLSAAMTYIKQRAPQHNWTIEGETTSEQPPKGFLRLTRPPHSLDYNFAMSGGQLTMIANYRTDYGRPEPGRADSRQPEAAESDR